MQDTRPTPPLRIIRLKEAAELLGISPRTCLRWEREGILPPRRKLGYKTRGWLSDEFEAWMRSRPVNGPNETEDAAAA